MLGRPWELEHACPLFGDWVGQSALLATFFKEKISKWLQYIKQKMAEHLNCVLVFFSKKNCFVNFASQSVSTGDTVIGDRADRRM